MQFAAGLMCSLYFSSTIEGEGFLFFEGVIFVLFVCLRLALNGWGTGLMM